MRYADHMTQRGDFWKLDHLSDRELIASLGGVLQAQHQTLGDLVAHLGEVEERRLHLEAAHPSLFDYCVSRLHMSEDEACRRIELARLARRFPALFPLIAAGELTLSVALLLKPVITPENNFELIAAVRGKTIRQARETLAALFPSPDVPPRIRKLPEPLPRAPAPTIETALPVAPSSQTESTRKALPPAAPARPLATGEATTQHQTPELLLTPPSPRSRIEPIAAQRYKVQFTADASLKEKLEIARDLLRHSYPDGDLAPIVSRALDLLITDLKRARFGVGARPKAAHRRPARANPAPATAAATEPEGSNDSHVSRATRRAVVDRDGLACSWVGDNGKRCESRAWLELDHQQPRGKGGDSGPANIRILCHAHNQLAAERAYGREHMARAREERRKKGGRSRSSSIHANSPDG